MRTRGVHRCSEALEKALDSPSDGRTRSRAVRALRDAYIAFARGNTDTYRLLFKYPENSRDDPAYREAHARLWRTIAADMNVMLDEGLIEAAAPISTIGSGRHCAAR